MSEQHDPLSEEEESWRPVLEPVASMCPRCKWPMPDPRDIDIARLRGLLRDVVVAWPILSPQWSAAMAAARRELSGEEADGG